jgi:putative membrane protein
MASSLLQFIVRCFVLALGVTLATHVAGIHCDGGSTLAAVVVVLTLFNSVLKPLLVLFTLPFILLTMGLGVVLINALLLFFVGHLVPGFHVDHFSSAVFGSLVISATNLGASLLLRRSPPPPPDRGDKSGDVIDI